MKSTIIAHGLALLAGAIYALCYPSTFGAGWFPLLFLSLPLFLWVLETSTFKESLGLILCFNLGLNVVGYYWIPHTLREFGSLPYLLSILVGLAFSLILQPHWWLYACWRRWRPAWFWTSEKGVIVSAAVITILERYVPQQFPSFVGSPWLHLSPYLGMAPVLGTVAFSFMTYWLCLEAIVQLTLKQFRWLSWVSFSCFLLVNGFFPLQTPESTAVLPIRIVQANIGNFLKVSSELGDEDSYQSIIENYRRLSTVDNGFSPELVVWPETAYPGTFYGQRTNVDRVFLDIMDETQAEMLIGGYDFDVTKDLEEHYETLFNSSILLGAGKVRSSYHKNILIPFGETLPFGALNKQIIGFIPGVSLFARGAETPLMETRAGHRFVTPICYEILESNYMRKLLGQWGSNHFIVNHTNDSWYGDTAEPHQHLFLSKWRALEFQLPIVRSTNTGISSVIYPDGSESRRLGVGETGVLEVRLPIGPAQNTTYQRYGALGAYLLMGLFFLIAFLREKKFPVG